MGKGIFLKVFLSFCERVSFETKWKEAPLSTKKRLVLAPFACILKICLFPFGGALGTSEGVGAGSETGFS